VSPILLGLYPVLYIYSLNLGLVAPSVLWNPLMIAFMAAIALNGFCALCVRDWRRGALVADTVLFFSYLLTSFIDAYFPWIYESSLSQLAGCFIIVMIVAAAWTVGRILRKTAEWRPWTAIANVCIALLLVSPLLQIGWFHLTILKPQTGPPPATVRNVPRPDVYYVILDGYTRADILAQYFGYDNKPFIRFLWRKGFYVASQSQSNYAYTYLSLASSLNMEYIQDINAAPGQQAECIRRIENNIVMRIFMANGYRVMKYAPTWLIRDQEPYTETTFNPRTVNEFENLVLKQFLLSAFLKQGVMNMYKVRALYTLHRLETIPQGRRPKFIFAHVLCPHPPYVFDREGNTPEPKIYAHRPAGSHDWYPKSRYADQVHYLNTLVEKTIDGILKNSKTPPLIIIQGDHGAACDGTSDHPTPLMVRERISILNAYYVPPEVRKQLYPTITPVNTFRLICSYLFQGHFTLLPDRSYYSGPMDVLPYKFKDVTNLLEEKKEKS